MLYVRGTMGDDGGLYLLSWPWQLKAVGERRAGSRLVVSWEGNILCQVLMHVVVEKVFDAPD